MPESRVVSHAAEAWPNALDRLRGYMESEHFAGYDPYDALTSPFPFLKLGKWPAVLAQQAVKRFPLNLRPLLGIRKSENAKAMGLLLHGYSLLYQMDPAPELRGKMDFLFRWLKEHQAAGYSGPAWGYPFPWASTLKTVPAGMPTSVATGFVAKGIYKYHLATGDAEARDLLVRAARFITEDLHLSETDEGLCISYTPLTADCCYNASLLGAETLAIAAALSGDEGPAALARRALDFVIRRQHPDGKWNYSLDMKTGVEREQVDFHQGYIIDSIWQITRLLSLRDTGYHATVRKGLAFYSHAQFFPDGRSKWRYPVVWPVEIHNQAQGLITFSRMAPLDDRFLPFARTIAAWTIRHMQDTKGYFYYRRYRRFVNRIPYMRWSQAWMFLALCELIQACGPGPDGSEPAETVQSP